MWTRFVVCSVACVVHSTSVLDDATARSDVHGTKRVWKTTTMCDYIVSANIIVAVLAHSSTPSFPHSVPPASIVPYLAPSYLHPSTDGELWEGSRANVQAWDVKIAVSTKVVG